MASKAATATSVSTRSVHPGALSPITAHDKNSNRNLGVLYTGWLDKKNPITGYYKKRFVALTGEAIHWFKRAEKCDLFGEERGQILLSTVLSVRILDEDSTVLAIQSTDRTTRYFKGADNTDVEEWVSAIRTASHKPRGRRNSTTKQPGVDGRLSGEFFRIQGEEDGDSDVTVLLVSVKSASKQAETVVARLPAWDRVINISDFSKGDELIISTSNSGLCSLGYEFLELRAEEMSEFDAPLHSVAIPQSLRMTVARDFVIDVEKPTTTANTANAGKRGKFARFIEGSVQSNTTVSVVMLSILVLCMGVNSFISSRENLLIMILSIALALVSISVVTNSSVKTSSTSSLTGTEVSYTLVIKGHTYTSPDAPVHEMDDEIPERFITGCEGDLKEARRRWDITRHWRESEGVNNILEEPQPNFFIIKAHYPHYHAGRGKEGHIIFYERPGDLELTQLKARGIYNEHLLRHWLFVTEYQWKVLVGDELGKSISVIDIEHVGINDLTGDPLDYLRKTIGWAGAHYPERSYVIFVVNAPMWFSFMWKMLKPLIHPNTQKKIKILSKRETLLGMQEHIDVSQIPEYYGGEMDFGGHDSCRFKSPDVLELEEFVRKINNKAYGGEKSGVSTEQSAVAREAEAGDNWSVSSAKTASTATGNRGGATNLAH